MPHKDIIFYTRLDIILVKYIIIIIIIDTFIKRHKCLGYRGAEATEALTYAFSALTLSVGRQEGPVKI